MIRPDSKFASRTTSSEKKSHIGGSDSKFVTGIGHSSNDNTFGKTDNKYTVQPKSHDIDTHVGRIDRGKPLYHGGTNSGDDSYNDSVLDSDTNSLELMNRSNFSKSHKT